MIKNKNCMLQESAVFSDAKITKSDDGYIEFIAVLQEADAPNRNGRIYPKAVLEQALQSPYVQERIDTKTFYGEAGHPMDENVKRQMGYDHHNFACIVTEYWWEGNLLKGRVETAKTEVGRDMKGLIEQGSKVGFSLRAQGTVHNDPSTGKVIVDPGLSIFCYDWVVTPSHNKAFMEQICEDTAMSMFNTSKTMLTESVLNDYETKFNSGTILDTENIVITEQVDYARNYRPNHLKNISEMYLPESEDKVMSMNEDFTMISNSQRNVTKKVLTEDYIVKDIRAKILELGNVNEAWSQENVVEKQYTKEGRAIGGVIGFFGGGGIIGALIGRFMGHRIQASMHDKEIDKLYKIVRNDAEAQGYIKEMKEAIKNNDKKYAKQLKKDFADRVRELKIDAESSNNLALTESFDIKLESEIDYLNLI